MAIRLEIVVNDSKPVVIGFEEEKYAISAIINAGVFKSGKQDISITASGLQPETGYAPMWLNQSLQPGDRVQITVVEDIPISDRLPDTA